MIQAVSQVDQDVQPGDLLICQLADGTHHIVDAVGGRLIVRTQTLRDALFVGDSLGRTMWMRPRERDGQSGGELLLLARSKKKSAEHAVDAHESRVRRSPRVLARVALRLSTERLSGSAVTAVINRHGAMVLSSVKWSVGERVWVMNLGTEARCEARVVWEGREDPNGLYKLGLEFEAASASFWGEDYPR
jgi:hypothetical protein